MRSFPDCNESLRQVKQILLEMLVLPVLVSSLTNPSADCLIRECPKTFRFSRFQTLPSPDDAKNEIHEFVFDSPYVCISANGSGTQTNLIEFFERVRLAPTRTQLKRSLRPAKWTPVFHRPRCLGEHWRAPAIAMRLPRQNMVYDAIAACSGLASAHEPNNFYLRPLCYF